MTSDLDLAQIVKRLIWANVICWGILTLVIMAVGLFAWRTNHQHIRDSEQIVVSLCRELNARNLDLKLILLDSGIHAHDLKALDPVSCSPSRLRNG